MKILITGANGQLGQELMRQLQGGGSVLGPLPASLQGAKLIAVDVAEMDISQSGQVAAFLGGHKPDVVINCAAFTNVDLCETQQDTAFAVNALGARNLALACANIGAKLVHISTDYVFSGQGETPFAEGQPKAPQSVYGLTKHLGEEYVMQFCPKYFVVRTAWLYGQQGNNFVKTILKIAAQRETIEVVNDQMGNPTNAEDLAHHLLKMCAGEEYGIYHCTGGGVCSWYNFAAEIVKLAGFATKVQPCTTQQFPRPAKRPAFSALGHTMLRLTIGDEMRPWQQALADYMQKNKQNI